MALNCKKRNLLSAFDAGSLPLSDKTIIVLKDMMKEINLPYRRQQEILKIAREGKALPFPSRNSNKDVIKAETFHKRIYPMPNKFFLRPRRSIELSGAYEREQFRPCPSKIRSAYEKERLQNIMAYGKEYPPELKNILKPTVMAPDREIDLNAILKARYEEILTEIEERKQFLSEMVELGLGDKYALLIDYEISQRISELEQINRERLKNFEEE